MSFITKALSYRLAGIDSGIEEADISVAALHENGEKHYLIDELIFNSKILLSLADERGDVSFDRQALKTLLIAVPIVNQILLTRTAKGSHHLLLKHQKKLLQLKRKRLLREKLACKKLVSEPKYYERSKKRKL